MSSKQQQQKQKAGKKGGAGAAPLKRKGEESAAAAEQQTKKSKHEEKGKMQAKPAAKQQQQQASKKDEKQKQKQKPAKKTEQEEEEEEDDDDGMPFFDGEVDEKALSAIEGVSDKVDEIMMKVEDVETKLNAELRALYAKYSAMRRPLLDRRDALLSEKLSGMWGKLLEAHPTFSAQFDDADHEIVPAITRITVKQEDAPEELDEDEEDDEEENGKGPKETLQVRTISITFKDGVSKHIKAGTYSKRFVVDEDGAPLQCVLDDESESPSPFTKGFADSHPDSFLLAWFEAEGVDEGVLTAQHVLATQLYQDPLELYRLVAQGCNDLQTFLEADDEEDSDDDEEMAAMFQDEEDDDDDDAPQLVDA